MKKDNKKRRQTIWRKGKRAEILASMFLRAKGYRLIARNVRLKSGEIDLIVYRGGVLVIVEVKARPTLNEGLEAISLPQRKRIINATNEWLAKEYEQETKETQKTKGKWQNVDIRYDVVVVASDVCSPYHLENAYEIS